MRTQYLRRNDPYEMELLSLFHGWGDLLLANYMANETSDVWITGLATRWTIQTAWSCFELAVHLALGRDINDPRQKLSPRFWSNVNAALLKSFPAAGRIDHTLPPWDDWHLIQEERHPFVHLGAGGGRFPAKADAQLAVEEAEKAIKRFFSLVGRPEPRWLKTTATWPKNTEPLRKAFGPH
jgi:hypothetical protein